MADTGSDPTATDDDETLERQVADLLWTDQRERERARRYHRVRRHIGYWVTGAALTRRLLFAGTGGSAALESALRRSLPSERLVAPAYVLTTATASFVLDLPVAFFTGHRFERAFGLTKQPGTDWLRQRLLGFAISSVVQVAGAWGLHLLVRRRPDDWWLVVSAAAVPASLLAGAVFPALIMPRFNRFTRFDDAALVDRLRTLGDRAGVRVADVYQMDMSRQTERANAMFTGMGRTRRIILGDTLLRDFTPDEIAGVIAHELGHQVNRDIWTLSAIGSGALAGIAFATNRLTPEVIGRTTSLTGIRSQREIAALDILGLVATVASALAGPLMAAASRRIERRTDRFAMELTGDARTYAEAMARLGRRNLIDPAPPRRWARLMASHPPIPERIATALRVARRGRSGDGD